MCYPTGLPTLAQDRNNIKKCFIIIGERGGTRTLDPMIKRKAFKAFSIMISTKAVDNLWAVSCSNKR